MNIQSLTPSARVAVAVVGRPVILLGAVGGALAGPGGQPVGLLLLAGVVAVFVALTVWLVRSPGTRERFLLGPRRRFLWRRWARRSWPTVARECGLSVSRQAKRRTFGWDPKAKGGLIAAQTQEVVQWVHPRLANASTDDATLTLWVQCRVGQTREDLIGAVPAIAVAAGAVSHSTKFLSPSTVEVVLVMRDQIASTALAAPTHTPVTSTTARPRRRTVNTRAAATSSGLPVGVIDAGRTVTGARWLLDLRARQTLVVGCSGSGKGSVLWGACGGLAPHVATDTVRLWGVDLKGGVEVAVGQGLFHATAYDPEEALSLLAQLRLVIVDRTTAMRGLSREHKPSPGDPLHVLVIDELAALLAYADADTIKAATRDLSVILTQGRAVGVIVLAFVQDPRKETVKQRGLFTQVLALRLRSADETRMVLGDGMAALAPAHALSPSAQGSGYLVTDEGHVLQVRADYWTDDTIRHAAASFPATTRDVPDPEPAQDDTTDTTPAAEGTVHDLPIARPARKPRAPRKPRTRRASVPTGGADAA